tara:strand:+ start:64 stop:927 length:864 start_codon:yes stop_codon:yes gene_type:complete
MAVASARPKCLLIGTCIAEGMEYFLRSSAPFMQRFELQCFWTNDHDQRLDLDRISAELHDNCEAAIFHPREWADWGNEDSYLALIEAIPEATQKITIPYPVFTPLWPFHCFDPRNKSCADRIAVHGGRVRYPYGDSHVLSRIMAGDSRQTIIEDYLAADVPAMIDIDHMFKTTFAIQMRKEATTTVKVLDYILDTFQTIRGFNSMNHVSNSSLLHMSNQVLEQLGLPMLPLSILERTSLLVRPEMPLHPSLIRYFGLSYVDENTRYEVNRYQRLTFPEYLANYIDFV